MAQYTVASLSAQSPCRVGFRKPPGAFVDVLGRVFCAYVDRTLLESEIAIPEAQQTDMGIKPGQRVTPSVVDDIQDCPRCVVSFINYEDSVNFPGGLPELLEHLETHLWNVPVVQGQLVSIPNAKRFPELLHIRVMSTAFPNMEPSLVSSATTIRVRPYTEFEHLTKEALRDAARDILASEEPMATKLQDLERLFDCYGAPRMAERV